MTAINLQTSLPRRAGETLKVNEIYLSLQGESTFAGHLCSFIRLTGCNLRCSWCDTQYAYDEGKEIEIPTIISRLNQYGASLVEITGGEPLLQNNVSSLIEKLLKQNFSLLLDTNGSLPIAEVDSRVVIILDLKCPSSGMTAKMDFENLNHLKKDDQVKFVIADREDFRWARDRVAEFSLPQKCKVHFSPVFEKLPPRELADWIKKERLDVRLNLQWHKYIWPERKTDV